MKRGTVTYNERSWAIDLIGHLKLLAAQQNRTIKGVGGEQTINVDGGSLFPDVLLFGDRGAARILQGWELKMPDTDITDVEFRNNAESKARALGLDSFLLWNVSHAHLYILEDDTGKYVNSYQWSELADIRTRSMVVSNHKRWKALASDIFGYLNDLFDRGSLEGRQFIDAYRSGGITSLIMENASQVAEALAKAESRNGKLRAEVALWWDRYKTEYTDGNKHQALAQMIISNWIGKILFGHILREKDVRAQRVATISEEITPTEALDLFRQLSEDCNFWTIFSDSIGLKTIPARVWNQLKQFNRLLSDLRIGSVDQSQLSEILEATVEVTVRKLRGQYPTPMVLARLLAYLCIQNTVRDRFLDPCSGSGTIARAVINMKYAAGVSVDRVAESVFASDLDPQAVQITTFALARPGFMNIPLRIFQHDAFALTPNSKVDFRDPTDGTKITETVGIFDAIASNLPFVAQDGRRRYIDALDEVAAVIEAEGSEFPRRADIAAYLPFSFHPLLRDGGRLGIIITNAWLGTDWGDKFYSLLSPYYDLKSVITSGARRWFQSSEVVTNILIMEKKSYSDQPNSDVNFVVLTRPLEEISDEETARTMAAQIELGQTQNDTMTIRSVSPADLNRFKTLGLRGNAQFVNCDWVLDLPICPLKELFIIRRGERRGMNALFYPASGHGIEIEYIRPLVKGPTDFAHLKCSATKEAFVCSRTKEELLAHGHIGALNWIERFETSDNVKKLSTSQLKWYEMKEDVLADLVMFINYGERLFVGRVDPPAFADQRLVRLQPKYSLNMDIAHALLNSTISMFIIEGMGFGRGLGALDLNKDRIEDYMHILDPRCLNQADIRSIKKAFQPLLRREILDVADELEQEDRRVFDDAISTAFGLTVDRQEIYDALLALVGIRQTAVD